jgi:hypothetical protein
LYFKVVSDDDAKDQEIDVKLELSFPLLVEQAKMKKKAMNSTHQSQISSKAEIIVRINECLALPNEKIKYFEQLRFLKDRKLHFMSTKVDHVAQNAEYSYQPPSPTRDKKEHRE